MVSCPRCGAGLASAGERGCAACALEAALGVEAMPEQGALLGGFGEYDLVSVLARGGMGVVYVARQRAAGRLVALKMIAAPFLAGEVEVRRFRAEAEAVAGLEHGHIVPLYDVGEVDGQLFFTMRLMEGGTLGERMAREPRAPDAVLLSKVARAVHYAHERGVLHRDLKPANILLDAAGEPGVADFGLALRVGSGGTRLTVSGAAMGTPDYMAPEQASGKSGHATTGADIYSLGAMLYEWLTGRAPFASPTPLETMRRVMGEEAARPSSIYAKVDRDLETIALRCLEKEPARRYATAAALADDLDRQGRGEPILARPAGTMERLVKWSRRRPALAALLALAILVPAGAAYFFALYQGRVESEARTAGRAAQERYAADIFQASRAIEMGQPYLARALLDGWAPRGAGEDLRGFEWHHLRSRLRGDDVRVLAGPEQDGWRATVAGFAPGGHRLAIGGDNGMVALGNADAAAAQVRWQAHAGAVQGLDFSADGRWLATLSTAEMMTRLWSVPLPGSPAPDKPQRELPGRAVLVDFAPHGPGFVVGMEHNGERSVDFFADPAAAPQRLPGTAQYAWFSRDGARLYTLEIAPGISTCRVLDATTRLPLTGSDAAPLIIEGCGSRDSLTFSGDGTLMANVLNGVNLAAWRTDAAHGSRPVLLTPAPQPSYFATRTAFLPPRADTPSLAGSSPPPATELLAVGTAHGGLHFYNTENWLESFALRGHEGNVNHIAFSSDGVWMATCGADGSARLWHPQRPDAPPIRIPLEGPRFLGAEGNCVAGVAHGSVRLWDMATGAEREAFPGAAFVENHEGFASHRSAVDGGWRSEPALQPDGGYLARVLREPDATALVANFRQYVEHNREAGAGALLTSPDGQSVAIGQRDGALTIRTLPGGAERAALRGHVREVCRLHWSAGGQWLAASDGDGRVDLWQLRGSSWKLAHSLNLEGATTGITFSADGRLVAIAGGKSPRSGVLADLETGALADLRGTPFTHVAFSPDGRTLATAADKKVSLWQAASGRYLAELEGGGMGNVLLLHFSADGRTLVHGSYPALHLWRTEK